MNLIQAFYMSIVEGLTEFLPVSSTFHLLITANMLGLRQSEFVKFFEVFIQAGAILAVSGIFFREVKKNPKILIRIGFAFVPTAVIGFGLYKVIKNVFFESGLLTLGAFVIVGYIFILSEKYIFPKYGLDKSLDKLTNREAIIIGIVQAFAVVPGVSRAGAVMLGLMGLRYRRDEAALFSFYLAIPTILAASIYDLYKMRHILSQGPNFIILAAGFLGAYISATIGVRWFVKYLQGHTLTSFGWYRIGLGIILLFVS